MAEIERLKWYNTFLENDIVRDYNQLAQMSLEDFQEYVTNFLAVGLEPETDPEMISALQASIESSYKPRVQSPQIVKPEPQRNRNPNPSPAQPSGQSGRNRPLPPRTESGQIRHEQNSAYQRALNQQIEKQKQEQARIEKEQKEAEEAAAAAKQAKSKSFTSKAELQKRAKQLPPEPADGVRIGFHFYDGSKAVRKFSPDSYIRDLKTFVAAQDQMFKEDGTPYKFELKQGLGTTLDDNKKLKAQGITRSTMFNVDLLDDDE